jgi:hypothetical protein
MVNDTTGAHKLAEDVLALLAELQRLRDALVLLADNAEAYLNLEEDGERNYPDSLRLCITEARAALDGTPSAVQTLEETTPTKGTES